MDRAFAAKVQDNYTKVSTKALLLKLRANRDDHQQEWEEAHTKWRSLQIEKMKEYHSNLQGCIDKAEKGGKIEWPDISDFELDEPINHVKEYDRVIARLDMSVEDEIHISHSDFNKYVLDDWSWKPGFSELNSSYIGAAIQ